jgi:hypothetical protein
MDLFVQMMSMPLVLQLSVMRVVTHYVPGLLMLERLATIHLQKALSSVNVDLVQLDPILRKELLRVLCWLHHSKPVTHEVMFHPCIYASPADPVSSGSGCSCHYSKVWTTGYAVVFALSHSSSATVAMSPTPHIQFC